MEHILSVLRNQNTKTEDYRAYSNRLIRILLERAIVESEKKISVQPSTTGGEFEAIEVAFEHS